METPRGVIFVEGSLEATEHPAAVTGQDEETGALHLLVSPAEGEPFPVRDALYHPTGKPGYWTLRPTPTGPVPEEVLAAAALSEPPAEPDPEPAAEPPLALPLPADEKPALIDIDIDTDSEPGPPAELDEETP